MDTHNIPNVMVHHSLASKRGLNPSPTLSYMEDKGVNQWTEENPDIKIPLHT